MQDLDTVPRAQHSEFWHFYKSSDYSSMKITLAHGDARSDAQSCTSSTLVDQSVPQSACCNWVNRLTKKSQVIDASSIVVPSPEHRSRLCLACFSFIAGHVTMWKYTIWCGFGGSTVFGKNAANNHCSSSTAGKAYDYAALGVDGGGPCACGHRHPNLLCHHLLRGLYLLLLNCLLPQSRFSLLLRRESQFLLLAL